VKARAHQNCTRRFTSLPESCPHVVFHATVSLTENHMCKSKHSYLKWVTEIPAYEGNAGLPYLLNKNILHSKISPVLENKKFHWDQNCLKRKTESIKKIWVCGVSFIWKSPECVFQLHTTLKVIRSGLLFSLFIFDFSLRFGYFLSDSILQPIPICPSRCILTSILLRVSNFSSRKDVKFSPRKFFSRCSREEMNLKRARVYVKTHRMDK